LQLPVTAPFFSAITDVMASFPAAETASAHNFLTIDFTKN
jgi:hypothetical protein